MPKAFDSGAPRRSDRAVAGPCPAEQIGRNIGELIALHEAVDYRVLETKPGPLRAAAELDMAKTQSRLDLLYDSACACRAATLIGALTQLLVAHSEIDCARSCEISVEEYDGHGNRV